MTLEKRPPVLLTSAGYYGTLAAVRCYGRRGVELCVADSSRLAPASWSRYVQRRVRSPDDADVDAYLEWLLEFGRTHEPHVLYPTNDGLAWLLATEASTLSKYFLMQQPKVDAIFGLLHKGKLKGHAEAVGLRTPRTWVPGDDGTLDEIARKARFPVVVKPVTQILNLRHIKGAVVTRPEELEATWHTMAAEKYAPQLHAFDASVARPMVQELHLDAATGMYNLSGFVSDDAFVVCGSLKVLQRPRQLGVGICFEGAPVQADLAAGLQALCRRVGYRGVFEAEFIPTDEGYLLIDFNPRFYGQMALDIARGVELPMLAYHLSRGDGPALADEVASSQARGARENVRFCNRVALEVMLRTQQFSGALSGAQAASWRSWHSGDSPMVDAVIDRRDLLPAAFEVAHQLYGYARHPRAFVRSIVMNS